MLQKKMIDQEHIFLTNKYMQRIPSIPTKYYYSLYYNNLSSFFLRFFSFLCLFVDDFNSLFHDKSVIIKPAGGCPLISSSFHCHNPWPGPLHR